LRTRRGDTYTYSYPNTYAETYAYAKGAANSPSASDAAVKEW
jgi:hypothetical protein